MCKKDEDESGHLVYHMQDNNNFLNSPNICANYQDSYIPFPRTSGAKFCCVGTYILVFQLHVFLIVFWIGILVCFGRPSYARRVSIKPGDATPRALSALDNSIGNSESFMPMYRSSYVPTNDNMSISSYYFHDRVRNIWIDKNKNSTNIRVCHICVIYVTAFLSAEGSSTWIARRG